MTPAQAKRIIKAELQLRELPFTKLTARTIDFSDLARGSSIFVCIHGWEPNPVFNELKTLAHVHGFCVETDGPFG
jgi:hypothetical protein